jgi:hypothetical protein
MTTAQLTELDSPEAAEVFRWRMGTLLGAGYLLGDAVRLAMAGHVDLHAAVRLAERGCPSATAVRILL